jgi:hypothetical protein
MSTRCQILHVDFESEDRPQEIFDGAVYRHGDGYPDGESGVLADLLPLLQRFFKFRGFDPSYCLAHITAHFINLLTEHKQRYLTPGDEMDRYGFTGHGIEGFKGELHCDLAYVYIVHRDHVEVRETGNGHFRQSFWNHPVLANTRLVKRVKFDGKQYRRHRELKKLAA